MSFNRTTSKENAKIRMKMKFGIFMAPFHAPGHNPTLSLEHDLELIEHLDRLDYDEAWIGEHHSAGSEIIGSPEIFMMAAAARTKRIKLGTGHVLSVNAVNLQRKSSEESTATWEDEVCLTIDPSSAMLFRGEA